MASELSFTISSVRMSGKKRFRLGDTGIRRILSFKPFLPFNDTARTQSPYRLSVPANNIVYDHLSPLFRRCLPHQKLRRSMIIIIVVIHGIFDLHKAEFVLVDCHIPSSPRVCLLCLFRFFTFSSPVPQLFFSIPFSKIRTFVCIIAQKNAFVKRGETKKGPSTLLPTFSNKPIQIF